MFAVYIDDAVAPGVYELSIHHNAVGIAGIVVGFGKFAKYFFNFGNCFFDFVQAPGVCKFRRFVGGLWYVRVHVRKRGFIDPTSAQAAAQGEIQEYLYRFHNVGFIRFSTNSPLRFCLF